MIESVLRNRRSPLERSNTLAAKFCSGNPGVVVVVSGSEQKNGVTEVIEPQWHRHVSSIESTIAKAGLLPCAAVNDLFYHARYTARGQE